MSEEIRVVVYGVGLIGQRIAKAILDKKKLRIVGAVDVAEDKLGKDLGGLIGIQRKLGVRVSDDPDSVFKEADADISIISTSSYLKGMQPQLAQCIRAKTNVISTCEEMAYPWRKYPKLSGEIDALAKEHGVTVLGTGINPGFLMDTLVITLTSVCQEIENIRVTRVIDAASRRLSFQKKIGAGLSAQEFEEKIKNRAITGHVGLEESIALIGYALDWDLDEIKTDPVEPVIAEESSASEYIRVKPGEVAGLTQIARGVRGGEDVITLDFQAYLGAKEEYDSIDIKGAPNIKEKTSPCVHGDVGTVAIVLNCIPRVIDAAPGLLVMSDLPPSPSML